jgi:hypothetical protein
MPEKAQMRPAERFWVSVTLALQIAIGAFLTATLLYLLTRLHQPVLISAILAAFFECKRLFSLMGAARNGL